MIYLLVGQDNSAKEHKIAEIKASVLPTPESLSFDYQILYGHRLEDNELKEALMALPAVGKARVVVVHQADELNAGQKAMIVDVERQSQGKLIVILTADAIDKKDALFIKFSKVIKAFSFSPRVRQSVFDLMRAVSVNRKADALTILDELLRNGDYPLQILGGMFWKWKNDKKQVSAAKFRNGLLAFEQADFNIKRSQLKPEHALEVLVIKLCA